MADIQRLFFESAARVSDREVLIAARLNARVRSLLGAAAPGASLAERINAEVVDEMDRMIAQGVLRHRIDWLAVQIGGQLQVAFGSRAVQQLCRELHGAPPA